MTAGRRRERIARRRGAGHQRRSHGVVEVRAVVSGGRRRVIRNKRGNKRKFISIFDKNKKLRE